MKSIRRQTEGFTIVELLIVIVVIAILAAITIVAFNGIQNRAKDTQMVSAMNAYVKGMGAYYTTHSNTLPTVPACFDGTACWSGVTAPQSVAFRTSLSEEMSNLPTVPTGFAGVIANGTTADVPNGGNYTGFYIVYQHSTAISSSCATISGTRYLNSSTAGTLITCRAALIL